MPAFSRLIVSHDLYLGPDSVAVLPFTNERGDANSDYLSDGIAESLIGSLARVPQLKVRSRDSAFRYKGKDVDVRTIGNNLGVSVVVSWASGPARWHDRNQH